MTHLHPCSLQKAIGCRVQDAIETLLRQKIGLDASSIGSNTIARVIDRRRLSCGLPDRAAYLTHLQSSPQELENLIEAVVVPETWFFRDREPFVYLRQFVIEWRSAHPAGVFRVLSAPCSTGEEPYSIAMTLLKLGLTPAQFKIDAVDISQRALLKAKRGIYGKQSFRGGGVVDQSRYFEPVENGHEIRPFVGNTVNFMQGNLLNPGFLSRETYHAIFCRNLLIYLDRASRNQVIEQLDRHLAPSGLLFLGASETAQILAKHFTPIRHPFAFGYCKENHPDDRQNDRPLTTIVPSAIKVPVPKAVYSEPIPKLEMAQQLADRGQLREAIAVCKSYLTIHSTDDQAYLLLGEIHQGLDQSEQAEQAFQKAIYLNPKAYEAMTHLALLKEQRGDQAGATLLKQRIQRLLDIQH